MKQLFSLKTVKKTCTETSLNVPTTWDDQISRLEMFLKNGKSHQLTPTSIKGKRDAVNAIRNRCIKGIIPGFREIDYSQEFIAAVRDTLSEQGRDSKTMLAYLYALKDLYEANGHAGFVWAMPKITEREAVYHTHDECMRIIRAAGNVRDNAILSLVYYAALRNKEARWLYIDDIDFKTGCVYVRDHGQGIKTYEERTVDLSEKPMPAIRAWLDLRVSPEFVGQCDSPLLFVTQRGKMLEKDGMTALIKRAGGRAGIETHPHALRHSRASFWVNNGMPLNQAQKLLGHKYINTTQKYLHASRDQIRASVCALDR